MSTNVTKMREAQKEINELASALTPVGFVKVDSGKLQKGDLVWNNANKNWDVVTIDGWATVENFWYVVREVKF